MLTQLLYIQELVVISILINNRKMKNISFIKNIIGQEVDINYNGLKIVTYEDGTSEKSF